MDNLNLQTILNNTYTKILGGAIFIEAISLYLSVPFGITVGITVLAIIAWALESKLSSYLPNAWTENEGTIKSSLLTLAIANFDEAIRLNPQLAQAYANRGLIHKTHGNLTAAR